MPWTHNKKENVVDVDIQIKRLEFWYKHEIDPKKIKEIYLHQTILIIIDYLLISY